MIVNGIDNPRVQCPGGDPEELHINGDVYPCLGDGCIVEAPDLDWTPYEGTTEMWCRNGAGDSPVVPLVVPEPCSPWWLFALAILLGFLAGWRR